MSANIPILAPAMKLIGELQQQVASQQATIAALQARVNELSSQLDLPPLAVAPAPEIITGRPADPAPEKPASAPAPAPVAEPAKTLYADQPLMLDGTAVFETDYVNEIPNCYKLDINGCDGKFILSEDPQFYEMLAFGLADMVVPVADYAVEEVPNGNDGFNMADLTQCELVNVAPGEIRLEGPYWKVTKKAQVQFKLK